MFGFILTGVQTLIVTSCNRARGWFRLVGLRVDLKILCLERIENHIKLSTSSITDFTFPDSIMVHYILQRLDIDN